MLFIGTTLHRLELDSALLSEMLRLHLLSSGARRLSCHVRSDLQQRGGYSCHDNPALDFCQRESVVMDRLKVASIYQLSPGTWQTVCFYCSPSPPLDNIRVMVIVWRLRGNIIRTALCWIVWHNVHSLQHTYVSSSYRSNRLGLSHWDPYTVCRSGCLGLCYCNMVEWYWCDSSLIFDDQLVSFSALTLLVWSSGL